MTPFPTTKKRLVIACLSAMAMNANAADVELKIKHVDGDYGTPYSYQGYKSEIEIKPDDSRWYYNGEAREYNHDSGQQYSRFGVGIGYQFPIEGGFIKPEFKIRSERNDYGIKSDGTRGSVIEADSKILKTQYVYEIYNWFKLAGEFSFSIISLIRRLEMAKHQTMSVIASNLSLLYVFTLLSLSKRLRKPV